VGQPHLGKNAPCAIAASTAFSMTMSGARSGIIASAHRFDFGA
jgi:uncharacterized protein (DUF2345 family)